jgi:hypothetical protein
MGGALRDMNKLIQVTWIRDIDTDMRIIRKFSFVNSSVEEIDKIIDRRYSDSINIGDLFSYEFREIDLKTLKKSKVTRVVLKEVPEI